MPLCESGLDKTHRFCNLPTENWHIDLNTDRMYGYRDKADILHKDNNEIFIFVYFFLPSTNLNSLKYSLPKILILLRL